MIHERKSATRLLGQAGVASTGAPATPKAAIGLGISATRPKTRTPSGGQRKVSNEKGRVVFPSVSGERRTSGERKVSGSKENDSPDVRYTKRTPKSSMGLKSLERVELVSKSPFKRSTSVAGLLPSTRANESPSGPSPKTIPIDSDDVFSSPSPRRTSGGKRRVSSDSFKSSARTSESPPTSSPRSFSQTVSTTGPSPLSQPLLAPPEEPSPTPTPAKSSMTPSRRLRGPRDLTDSTDSPTKAKTVTFQSIPDVKEFERMSTEDSADGSFEVDEEQEWIDDADTRENDNSLDDLLEESSLDGMSKLRVTNPDDGQHDDESTTADFVNTLIEEGLFSPPQMATPAFESQPDFGMREDKSAPFLSTPSLGSPVQATPLLGFVEPMSEVDSAGIPYGRTHHAERATLAHSLPMTSMVSPLEQPDIPRARDHQMLLNANAAQPSLPHTTDSHAISHQYGPMADPFITIQTATKVLSPGRSRSQDGIPLDRTSHTERVHAAQMLATQSLGLGMPRSPAFAKDLNDMQAVEGEMLFDASFEESQGGQVETLPVQEKEEPVRRLPKPPKPQQLDLPSPVSSPVKEEVVEKKVSPNRFRTWWILICWSMKSNMFDFSLPKIGFTSPFFPTAPTMPGSGSSTDENEHDRPLTPPPSYARRGKEESPHEIPSFEFEDAGLHAVGQKVEVGPAKVIGPSAKPVITSSVKAAVRPVAKTETMSSATVAVVSPVQVLAMSTVTQSVSTTSTTSACSTASSAAEFGDTAIPIEGSTTTRVRQRISREMIRETIQQRIAEGSLSRKPLTDGQTAIPQTTTSSNASTAQPGMDKDLPLPPFDAIPMSKAHTTDAPPRQSADERPKMRARSQTQSAHQVLKANERDGLIAEPKSALDKLIQISGPTVPRAVSTASVIIPVSILQNPKEMVNPLLPAPTMQHESEKGMGGREQAFNAKRQEEEGRRASSTSGASVSPHRRRRSLSVSDAGDGPEAVSHLKIVRIS